MSYYILVLKMTKQGEARFHCMYMYSEIRKFFLNLLAQLYMRMLNYYVAEFFLVNFP